MPIVRESPAAKTVWTSGEFTLARRKADDGPPTLVLAPSSARPSAAILERLEHAYALRNELDAEWAARPLSYSARLWQLTIEDPGGPILGSLVGGPWELRPFLRVAIGLASSLRRLHERGLVHRDLSPSNLFVEISTGRVWLSGFGIASRAPRERQPPDPPESITGTLAYMAPEQTGRMNRSIDARSDLYSCGVVLYEVLTGGLPFTASEPMEWIHCHVARRPVPPSDRVNGVPAHVSAIIMKLLAKNAEDRYQTAAGLEADLRTCLDRCDASRAIAAFPLGASDVADRLVIPERLYGREDQVATLAAAFNRVVHCAQSETVFVSGYSGIGKSSIVHELQKSVVHVGGTFASAKAEPFSRSVPYLTLARALKAPVRSLLARRQDELDAWKRAFHEALGSNGQLIVNLLPDLALVVGEQPPVPGLPPHEASNRFRAVFHRFIQVFAQPGRPLLLFLDDLQWLDESTIELLDSLVTSADTQHLLLVGAYRDNELHVTHPLTRVIDRLRGSGDRCSEIVLSPLILDDLVALIADTLRADPARVLTLARLVHAKTDGNPFFAIQFLTTLDQEGLLRFDGTAMAWTWDQAGIKAQGYTDNVVDLMVSALGRLPVSTRTALTGLACLGHAGEISTLSLIQGQSTDDLHAALREAVRIGLVVRTGSTYGFSHDRIQEAAYSLVDQDARAETHLRIGRLLRKTLSPAALEQLFEVVSHLNRGLDLLTTCAERVDTATLNLEAGRAAMAATAYASALKYLVTAEALLGADAISDLAALRFEMSLRRANCEVQTGAFDAANDRLSSLADDAVTLSDQAAVTGIRLVLHMATGQPDLAVQACLRYLRNAGTVWHAHPAEAEVRAETQRIAVLLADRSIESLLQLPIAIEPDLHATMEVLCAMVPAAILTDENLLGLVIARMTTLSIERGTTDGASYAYVLLNMVVGLRFGDYRTGARFGNLSVDLVDHRGLNRFTARVYLCFGSTIVPWTQALEAGRAWITRARDAAVTSGDLLHYAYSGNCLVTNLLATGQPLADVEAQIGQALAVTRQLRFGIGGALIAGQLMLLRALRGLDADVASDGDQSFDPQQFEARLENAPHLGLPACWYWIRKLQAAFYVADFDTALTAASRAQRLLWTSPGFFELAEYHFFHALALAGKYDEAATDERPPLRSALEGHHTQLAAWAESCVENFSDRLTLVAAEIARLDGRVLEALRLYEQAIQLAHARDFVHHEGLANELAGRCCAASDLLVVSRTYLLNARHCYERWGAVGKVRQMDDHYGLLESVTASRRTIEAIATPVEHLDLGTIVRVSQAVSNEIVLEKLVERLMVVAMQHAGGERGLLILSRGDEFRIEAEAISELERIDVRLLERPATSADLPESLLALVMRTKEAVIVDDASAETELLVGAWRRQRGSILCLPLVNQTILTGVLYIENTIASHAFTSATVAVLKLIASQAAVSIEKARLYADLRQTDAYLAQAQGLSHTGSFGWTPATATIFWSDETFRIFEVDGATTPTVELVMARTHPEDRGRVQELLERVSTDLSDWDLEHRLLMPNGSVKHLRVLAQAVRGLSAGSARFVGAIMDVTGSRQSQQALETAFREIQTLRDQVQEENVALREEIDRRSMFEELVGESPALRRVLGYISKVAPTDSSVLITGETGTGKELVARAIHKRSARASRPFVGVNCAAVPASLIASELFGHERGAFTGATEKRVGRFELADGGTLFLDEVGDLPADTQVALLRVLQEREFERVGGTRPIRVNVRVIAATNRDLESAIAEKTFRADLFYRLNVFPLEVPSLRDRQQDIPLLVEYFVNRFGKRAGKPIRGIGRKALELLKAYAWPGNIRELQNVIERAVIISDTGTLTVDARWLSSSRVRPPSPTQTLVAHERQAIEAALAESRGRVSGPFGAALKLGVPASTLETKIRALQIDKRRFKAGANPTFR